LAKASAQHHFSGVIEQASLSAAIADRYRLERQLGAGGMANVFLAHDLKHGREVAIKVLKSELAQSITAERFLREIGITARLNHPHILPLLDSGAAGDGEFLYYVMPVATGESLRQRLARSGAMAVAESIRCAIEVTEALTSAHAMGIVHRDIKPDNVLLSGGHAVVVDFGIAKAIGDARDTSALTMDGVSIGTPVYMAPEQAAGEHDVDHRADIYAVGAMLWEMCAGAPPFSGTLQQIVASKLSKPAPSLATKCPTAPAALVDLVARCLTIEPGARPQTAGALLDDLRSIANPAVVAPARRTALMAAIGVTLAVIALASIFFVRERRARWVHETAIPEIQRLTEADHLDSAFALATEAAARAPNDSALAKLWFDIAQVATFVSEPAGASVSRAPLNDTSQWIPVGTTPTPRMRIPKNAWFYRYAKPGYRTVTIMGARLGGSYVPIPDPIPLRRLTDPDTDMVLIAGGKLAGTLYGLNTTDEFRLSNFLMDRVEVTNRQYKAFVDAGGYTNLAFWDSAFVRDGRAISRADAMKLFVDRTGRPGPLTWVGGAPPPGQDDFPVGGVSWYEARAYARFAGKEIPTVLEWNAAAIPEAARWVVPHGRYETTGPARGGDPRGVSPRGVYDLAGNVREWTVNAREPGSRYILGGGWSDPIYLFSELYAQPELDRSAINGIRLIKRVGVGPDLARAQAPIPGFTRDTKTLKPVDDATFKGYLALYDYDQTPLNAKVEARDSSESDWIREDVTVDSPGDHDRLPVIMFVPRHAKPPYQAVVIWPASDALIMPDMKQLPTWIVDFIARSGRAVVYPVYEGTLGRKSSAEPGLIAQRDLMLRRTKDMRRALDYAISRGDVDSTRVAYLGASWGARLGGTAIAVEPRFKTAILYVAGLGTNPSRPEVDPVNFLPRIRIPVLMLSGKYDSVFPLELSQKPFFNLLGTPAADKKRIVYEGGHFLPRPDMVSESLSWLDHYLGPVTRR
jgi:formylglycine-generating enzyme required for sulfatase activity/dienelactone hydrolase